MTNTDQAMQVDPFSGLQLLGIELIDQAMEVDPNMTTVNGG